MATEVEWEEYPDGQVQASIRDASMGTHLVVTRGSNSSRPGTILIWDHARFYLTVEQALEFAAHVAEIANMVAEEDEVLE